MSSVLDGLAVDPTSDRAVFRQIADQLRTAIRDGRLSEGDRLPSEAALIDHYGVARMTIRNALQILETEGLTRAEHGRGVYVRRKPPVAHSYGSVLGTAGAALYRREKWLRYRP